MVVVMALIILAVIVLKMQSCALQDLFPEVVFFFSGGVSVLPLRTWGGRATWRM